MDFVFQWLFSYRLLSSTAPTKTIIEVNKQVSDVKRQGLKRGEYSKHFPADKAVMGSYVSEHGSLSL